MRWRIVGGVVALGTVAALVVGTTTTGSALGTSTTSQVSVDTAGLPAPSGDSQAGRISADGRFVVFQSHADLETPHSGAPPTWRLFLRDLEAGTTTPLTGGSRDAQAPTVSGDGGLVAYLAGSQDTGVEVVALDRTGPTMVRHQVTGTTSDLPYQRILPCDPPSGGVHGWPCGPQLSSDGTAVAYPARLASTSPNLTLLSEAADATTVVDFGSQPVSSGESVTRSVTLAPLPGGAIRFRGVSVHGSGFTLDRSDCSGSGPCTARVTYTASCPVDDTVHTSVGTLRTDATTPAGQTEVNLVGECLARIVAEAAPAVRGVTTNCAPELPPTLRPVQAEQQTSESGRTVFAAPPTGVGQASLVAATIPGTIGEDRIVDFRAPAGCAVQLVAPPTDQRIPGAAAPCVEGEQLGLLTGCTAYLLVRPTSVAPYVAAISVGAPGTMSSFLVSATGIRDVVIVRRDSTGHGDFAGVGKPDPVIASVDDNGDVAAGWSPSISADGRYVAFVSGTDQQTQVYVHDTDRAGDGTFQPGPTVLASPRPETLPRGAPWSAAAPTLSGDGNRVAFVGSDGIDVRDLAQGKTVLASGPSDNPDQSRSSSQPALSQDGSTVAFVTDVLTTDSASSLVYWRVIDGVFSGADGPPARVASVDSDGNPAAAGDLALPSIDGDGGRVTFQTGLPLVPTDGNEAVDVYLREWGPHLSIEPGRLDFGRRRVGTSTDPLSVTVTDDGDGPVTLAPSMTTGDFEVRSDGCRDLVLHTGESCRISVTATAEQPGRRRGTLVVRAASGTDQVLTPLTVRGTRPPKATQSPGAVRPPKLTLLPTITTPGGATTAQGLRFPPRTVVTLTWSRGLGSATVRADARGRFEISLAIFPHDVLRPRVLVAEVPGRDRPVRSDELLVVPAPAQPPDFDRG